MNGICHLLFVAGHLSLGWQGCGGFFVLRLTKRVTRRVEDERHDF